jgi:hypothetical protein
VLDVTKSGEVSRSNAHIKSVADRYGNLADGDSTIFVRVEAFILRVRLGSAPEEGICGRMTDGGKE